MSKTSIPYESAIAIILHAVAVKVQDWNDALLYPSDTDDGFELVDDNTDKMASVTGGKVVKETFDGGFKLTFKDDEGDTITVVPLGYLS
jgi:hypothetical protein